MIILGDCLSKLPLIDRGSINLVVTSPPYNVDLGNNKYNTKGYDIYKDKKSHSKYISFLSDVFNSIYPLLTDDGRVCINIGDGKNGQVPTTSNLIESMNKMNYKCYGHIIWDKKHTSNRAAWGSFMSPSCPSFPTPFEHILIFYKGDKKLQRKGITDLTKKEFVKWATSMWEFSGTGNKRHPAAYPLELPLRLIKLLTYVGDTVLDPFMGSGTTLVAAKMLNRKRIGIELSKVYYQEAKNWLKETI